MLNFSYRAYFLYKTNRAYHAETNFPYDKRGIFYF